MKLKSLILWTVTMSLIFMSCRKDERQAKNSIEGEWNIVGILSTYGNFSTTGFSPTETIDEIGELGTFNFTDNSVDFDFTRNDTLYIGSGAWNISAEKVREGFTRVNEFTLDIENHFLFDVVFEDATKNSEKNATSATFTETPTSGFGVLIEISLEKK